MCSCLRDGLGPNFRDRPSVMLLKTRKGLHEELWRPLRDGEPDGCEAPQWGDLKPRMESRAAVYPLRVRVADRGKGAAPPVRRTPRRT